MKVRNLTSERTGRGVANQFEITDANIVYFQSYDSICAKAVYHEGKAYLTFGRDWDYSKTTLKYLRVWLYDNYFSEYARMSKKELQALIDKGEIVYDENL